MEKELKKVYKRDLKRTRQQSLQTNAFIWYYSAFSKEIKTEAQDKFFALQNVK